MSAITSCLWEGDNWYGINNQFVEETARFVKNPLKKEIWRDSGLRSGDEGYHEQYIAHGGKNFRIVALGYDPKTYEDLEEAIAQKYLGKNRLLDFLNMQGELSATGVLDHKLGSEAAFWYEINLGDQLKFMFFPDPWAQPSQKEYDRALLYPLDVKALGSAMRKSLSEANFSGFHFDMQEVLDKAIDDLLSMADQ